MELDWNISQYDIDKVFSFVKQMESRKYVRKRIKDNVEFPSPEVSKELIWEGMFDCLLSSQQKSGPGSPIAKFLTQKPFPLSYNICVSQKNIQEFIIQKLGKHGGIRFKNNIAKYVAHNLNWFENDGWSELDTILPPLIEQRKQKPEPSHQKYEREVAHKFCDIFLGIGTKQARNYLQLLGLTRYEIPIDSRVVKWLNSNGFEVKVTQTELSGNYCYDRIQDEIQKLCYKGNILPCVLDACIFASFDEEWENDKIPF